MSDDYAALVTRLREAARVDPTNASLFDVAGNVIEYLDPDAQHNSWRHSEIRKLQERVRELEAVEKAARNVVRAVDRVGRIEDGALGALVLTATSLRAALREKGAEE